MFRAATAPLRASSNLSEEHMRKSNLFVLAVLVTAAAALQACE